MSGIEDIASAFASWHMGMIGLGTGVVDRLKGIDNMHCVFFLPRLTIMCSPLQSTNLSSHGLARKRVSLKIHNLVFYQDPSLRSSP